ncbi:MAG: ATP-binding protein [Christensenellales bacterium]
MPGTRAYLEARTENGRAVVSFKNISQQQLNIPVEELLERFVQGDESRSRGGSGLGLNIAESLTELMKGKLKLSLDGDLFKVELWFDEDKQ